MPKKDIVYNFITNLSSFQVQNIIDDISLLKEGYKLYYAIDTYDIICHYLPFTKSDLFGDDKKNIQAQKAIAYSVFFKNNSKKNIVILDEYKYELLSIKYYINKEIQNLYSIRKNLNSLKHELSAIHSDEKTSHIYLRNNFELILTLIMLSSLTKDPGNSIFSLLEDKMSIFSIDSDNQETEDKLNSIFKETKLSKFTELIYDKFVDEMSYFLLSIDSDKKRYTYLENTYRDIEAIDRLNQVNKKILDSFKEPQALFIYLSSAPFKSKEIFSIIENDESGENKLPEIKQIGKFNFHRNILQTYILDILRQEFGNNFNEQIQILDLLKKLSEQQQNVLTYKDYEELELKGQDKVIYDKLKAILTKYSSKIDNYFYYLSYEEYKQKLFTKSKDKSFKLDKEILKIINRTESFIEKEKTILEDFEYLSLNISGYRQTLNISSLIDSSGNFSYSVNISFGKDVIKNNFHHLPCLIFITDESNSNQYTELYALLNTIIDITHSEGFNTNTITPHLKNILNSMGGKNDSLMDMSKEFIIVTYISLLTFPKLNGNEMRQTDLAPIISENELIDLLKKQKKLISNTALRQKVSESQSSSRLEVEKQNLYYIEEINYMLLWLLRRNNYFDEAVSLGEAAIKETENDPRFYHGVGLACISNIYASLFKSEIGNEIKEESLLLLDKALVHLYKAVELYFLKLKSIGNEAIISVIKKNILAIYNSIADISIRKYVLLNMDNYNLIDAANNALENLKSLALELKITFEKYPIFNNTDAELKYYESLSFFNKGDIKNAHLYILQATNSVHESISKTTPMSKEFNKIFTDIENLRKIIFKQLGLIK
jgi:hypothetical protein